MPMRWDALLARCVAAELHAVLDGARLRAVRLDGIERDVVLLFREHALLWRLHPDRGYVRRLPPVEPAEGDLPLKSTLLGVETVPDDRVIRFRLAPSGSLRRPLSVVVELLGNQWNALVTEGDPEVVRHVLWRRGATGGHQVGLSYRPPRPLGRRGVDGDVTLEEWIATLGPLAPDERRAALVRTFAWTSPLNASALLGVAERPGEEPNLAVGFERWKRMLREAGRAQPVVLETDAGPQPYPFPLEGTPGRSADSLLAAMDSADTTAALGPALLRRLEAEAHRAHRRVERLEEELAELGDADALRRTGDLILARYREIPSGAANFRLLGFDGAEVEVELDPAEPPHENAARYYARATKVERARQRLPRLLEEARAEEGRLADLLTAARTGGTLEADVHDALGPAPPVVRGQVAGPALPYRTFRSSGGLEIRVGRGARHNDDLTFHHSAPGDVWMHARHSAGAHVILRWSGDGKPPARDLEEAATLAALHSKARTSGSVPVDWTFRKYVRKPRRSPPGQVLADRVETLFVEPHEALLEKLADER
jgi:predicted ribosome quality control (RQC) complex YloA/Tae2 family protein